MRLKWTLAHEASCTKPLLGRGFVQEASSCTKSRFEQDALPYYVHSSLSSTCKFLRTLCGQTDRAIKVKYMAEIVDSTGL